MTTPVSRLTASATWLYAYRWVDRLLGFGAIVVLARILEPEDFGLVAIAASYVAIIEGLSDFDVNSALIQIRDEHDQLYDSAWTLSALRGIASALLMVAVAPLVIDPRIGPVLYALALSPLVNGLSNPRFVSFERGLDYSRLALQTLTARLVSTGVTLAVALVYQTYWALVFGLLANTMMTVGLSYVLRPCRPRVSFSRFSEIFAFSGWMSLTTMVTTLSMQTDRIIVGRLLGVADAGAYYMTQRVGVVPTGELVSPLRRMLFPSFSEIAGDRRQLRRRVGESISILASLSLPAAVGFALTADDLVPIMLGPRWADIVPLLRILVPFLGLRATLSMTLPCVMALGRTRLLFGVSLVYAVVHLPLFVVGTAVFGLLGAISGIVAAGCFYSYLNAWMLRVTLDLPVTEILRQLRRPVLAATGMLASVLLLDAAWPVSLFSVDGSWLALTAKTLVGASVFGITHIAIWRLEGRPAGIERRVVQLLARPTGT